MPEKECACILTSANQGMLVLLFIRQMCLAVIRETSGAGFVLKVLLQGFGGFGIAFVGKVLDRKGFEG